MGKKHKALIYITLFSTLWLFTGSGKRYKPLDLRTLVYQSKDQIVIKIHGYSNLHDWDISTSKGELKMTFQENQSGQLMSLDHLEFKTSVATLHSGNKMMDDLAHAAFKSDRISLALDSARLKTKDYVHYHVQAFTTLFMSDTARHTLVEADLVLHKDKSLTIYGNKTLNMTDYHVIPPTFMMGALKVSKKVNLVFSGMAYPPNH